MKLDTHLYNLLQQFFNAGDNPAEQSRLQELALAHMEQRTPHISRVTALRTWAGIVDAFGVTK